MSSITIDGWPVAPRIGVVVPDEAAPGWPDAAFWCAMLEAWGFPSDRLRPSEAVGGRYTTLIVPAPILGRSLLGELAADVAVLATGEISGAATDARVVAFARRAADLDWRVTEAVADEAFETLEAAAPSGLVGLCRWPDGHDAALVVDGDVDHPTGVEPECSRYVAPALETARRAGYPAYGIFAAAANVDVEPDSFPPAAGYYNHSYSHPYSYWNPDPWEALDDAAMEDEIRRSDETFRKRLGVGDEGIFRLPHFQLEASDRTYAVLDRLKYRAESSIGGNVSITGGLPYHPGLAPWGDRPADAAYARTHPDPTRRRALLQLPISTDPTDPSFPHGCCSYNTLGEGVRDRTADPDAYEVVLEDVLERAVARHSLAHLFIDPPDAGCGLLPSDRSNYAGAVERWMRRAVERDDLAILSTAGLAGWWLARESAVNRLSWSAEGRRLTVRLEDPPLGAALDLLRPGGGGWARVPIGGAK